jgi:hypothetical protein
MHLKGHAAPETKAAVERARSLIEQAEALGEPLDDPLLLFSVLFALWTANAVAFNGDVCRDLAAHFACGEAKNDNPAHGWTSHHGRFLDVYWSFRGRSCAL